MSKTAFRWSLAIIALVMLTILSGIWQVKQQAHQRTQPPMTSTAQPLSPEWTRDFTRRVIETCDRLPVGHPDRPPICVLPR
jgi:hypothetical protein